MGEGLIVRRWTPHSPWGDNVPYYWEGEEFVETTGGWIAGYDGGGTGSQSKESNYLRIQSSSDQALRTWVTQNPIDLIGISALYIDWEQVGAYSPRSLLRVALDSNGFTNDVAADLFKTTLFSRVREQIDVASISGNYYLGLIGYKAGIEGDVGVCDLRIYKVWGEK